MSYFSLLFYSNFIQKFQLTITITHIIIAVFQELVSKILFDISYEYMKLKS